MIRLACWALLLSAVCAAPVASPGAAPTAQHLSIYDYDLEAEEPAFDYVDRTAKKAPAEKGLPKINKLINSQAFRNLFSVKPLCDDSNVDCARNVVYHFDLMGPESGERPNAAHY